MKRIAVASGKGGTGKTSLAVSLLRANPERSRLLDCDVEEPNCHLFLNSSEVARVPVGFLVPQVDSSLCSRCGKCVQVCQFNALAMAGQAGVLVFEALCHGCGGCLRVCSSGAIQEVSRTIGEVVQSRLEGGTDFVTGTLAIGHSSAPAVIRATRKQPALASVDYEIIDSPPGTACTFVAALEGADFVILVTEATPFGRNDLELAVQGVRSLGIPFGVVVNRIQHEENLIKDYCAHNGIPVLLQIPESRVVAETYARGGSLLDAMPGLSGDLRRLLEQCP